MLFETRQIKWRERPGELLALGAGAVRSRDQPGFQKVAVWTERALLGELGGVSADSRDRACMRVLDVDVERTSARIFERRDRLIAWPDAVDREAFHAVGILFEIGIAEDADGTRIGLDLLDDEIVVLAGFDVAAVLAHAGADRLVFG